MRLVEPAERVVAGRRDDRLVAGAPDPQLQEAGELGFVLDVPSCVR